MEKRWLILALLFGVRTMIGIQYQSVASTSAYLIKDFGINYTQLGTLIGLYQAPGILLALPGGVFGRRYGEKKVAGFGLLLMSAAGILMGVGGSFIAIMIGRLLCGVGAGVLGTVLTTMCMDWFTGHEIVTSMAIFVSSWPLGLSLGLVALGAVAASYSWQSSYFVVSALSLASLILLFLFYRAPDEVKEKTSGNSFKINLSRIELLLVLVAGEIWALFNFGFIVLPSFGPSYLASIGFSPSDASLYVSIVTWIVVPTIMLGGYISEKIAHPNLIMITCFAGIGAAMVLIPSTVSLLWIFILLGILFGPPCGLIMALPNEVLKRENRGAGMGVFLTVTAVGSAFLPGLAGFLQDYTGSTVVSILFGGASLFLSIILLILFRQIQKLRR
jgi:MFS family permease